MNNEIVLSIFRVMNSKGLLTDKELNDIRESMTYISGEPYLKIINEICQKE